MGEKVIVNNSEFTEIKYPNVALSSLGFKVIAFTNWHSNYPKVYTQILNKTNERIGLNFSEVDNYKKFNQYQSSVTFYTPTNFVVVWNDDRKGCLRENIFGQNYIIDETHLGYNYKISWYKNSFFPEVVSAENGLYTVV